MLPIWAILIIFFKKRRLHAENVHIQAPSDTDALVLCLDNLDTHPNKRKQQSFVRMVSGEL